MTHAPTTDCRILVVDNSPTVTRLLEELAAEDGHRVETARDGGAALRSIAAGPPDLVLLDLEMRNIDAYEVCRRVKQDAAVRLVPIVLVTEQPGFQARLYTWELGADDFLTKPVRPADLWARCRSLLRTKRLIDGLDPGEAVVFARARSAEARSPYTHGHSERVKDYALRLARRLGLSDEQCEVLGKGALLHDIGKGDVPDAILAKPGPLTAAEFERVKEHPVHGVQLVEPLPSLRVTLPLIRWHHERRDGQGYPDGLHGDAIPPLVRLLAVADVYHSLVSERPYRSAIPPERGRKMLVNDALNGGLDPELVECFCAMLAEEQADRRGGRPAVLHES